jgi:hypothetical protein
MNKAQRIILIVYCLLLVYCCLWIPWHIQQGISVLAKYHPGASIRVGYGWVWAGPHHPGPDAAYAEPDVPLILLRLLATTAGAGAAMLLAQVIAKTKRSAARKPTTPS